MMFKSVSLLSCEEYWTYRDLIPIINDWWWLRSSDAFFKTIVHVVNGLGNVSNAECSEKRGVRPFCIVKFEPDDPRFWSKPEKLIGTKIKWGRCTFTVLDVKNDELYILSDEVVYKRHFDAVSNNWDNSTLKKILDRGGGIVGKQYMYD